MKIAIIYDLHYISSIGGVEYRNLSLAKYLIDKGHVVHLFGAKMWKGKKKIKINKNLHIHGVSQYSNKYHFNGKRKPIDPVIYSFFLFFELMKHNFDIIDVSAFPYFPYFPSKLYSIIKRKAIVVTWHEVWNDYWKTIGKIGFFGKIIEKIVAKTSKNNISVSKLVKNKLDQIGGKNAKIIENWIDYEEISKIEKQDKKYDLISIGRHLKHKNFEFMIKMCPALINQYPKLKVLIIGQGPETINLLKLRQNLNLEKNVEILSFTKNRNQMLRYLKSSRVFLLFSELEGFSISSFEAMACGLPIITLDYELNALKEYIENGKNGFVLPPDKIKIVSKISNLLKDKKSLKNMSNNCINFSKNFDLNIKTNKIEKMYQHLINNNIKK